MDNKNFVSYGDAETLMTEIARAISVGDESSAVRTGKNLARITGTYDYYYGIAFTPEGSGVIDATGTATSTAYFFASNSVDGGLNLVVGQKYKLSGCPNLAGCMLRFRYNDGTNHNVAVDEGTDADGVEFTFTQTMANASGGYHILLSVAAGTTLTNAKFRPMLRRSEVKDATFEEYWLTTKELEESLDLLSYRGSYNDWKPKYAASTNINTLKDMLDALVASGIRHASVGHLNNWSDMPVSNLTNPSLEFWAPIEDRNLIAILWECTNGDSCKGRVFLLQADSSGSLNSWIQISGEYASYFSSSAAYEIGDLVQYRGRLYKCTTAHPAGSWNANQFTATTIADEISDWISTVDTALAAKLNTSDVDTALSGTSTNPVQNKVIANHFLTVDANIAAIRVMMDAHLYGFRISKNDNNPNTRVEYLYDAVGKTPASMDVSTGVFDYGSWGSDWFVTMNKPCALKFDGSVDYYLNPDDYTKKEDGTDSDLYVLLTSEPANWSSGYKNYFIKVDNSFVKVTGDTAPTFAADTYYSNSAYAGNFEAQIPLSYVKRWEDDSWWYTAISDKQVTPDFKAYAHTDENGTVHDYFYAPMFKGCIVDSRLRSIAGVTPQGNTTGSQENTAATACGTGWQLWDWSKHELISDLLILMSKSTDSQTSFGQGDTATYNASDTVTYGKLPTGTSGSGQFWGGTNQQHVKVFHIEDFWGNRWDRCLGLNLVNDIYVYKLVRPYALNTDGTYINSGLAAPTEGWQTASYIGDFGRFPKTTGGSSSTYDCDYFWKHASETRLALFGGSCNDGLYCGSRYVRLNYGSSGSTWNFGGSPCYLGTST